jgi:hypothetical protein
MRKIPIAIIVLALAVSAWGESVKTLRLALPAGSDPVVRNIGRVFSRVVQSRCDARLVDVEGAPLIVELAVEPGIGAEGFRIADGAPGVIRITGNDVRGLLYGTGKFLHTSSFGSDGFGPGSWRGTSLPGMPVRGSESISTAR